MLGRLGMSVDEAIAAYRKMGERVFSETKMLGDGKFKASKLESAIKEIVKERTGNSEEMMMNSDIEAPKWYAIALEFSSPMISHWIIDDSFVCAMTAANMAGGVPHLLRTYRGSSALMPDCKIVQAVRATTAAPTFFKRAYLEESKAGAAYVDGGMGCNNPIDWVLHETEELKPFTGRTVASVISIGTGHPGTISIPNPSIFQRVLPLDVVKAIERIATDCESKADETERRFAKTTNVYFRFNVDQGLQGVGLGEWERLEMVEGTTQQYIRLASVRDKLGRAVEALRGRKGVIPVDQISTTRVNA